MCGICGCSDDEHSEFDGHHSHSHHHPHDHEAATLVPIEQALLAKNDQFAQANRAYFLKNKFIAINVMSSPGSGKTTLLAKTIADLKANKEIAVVVGDQHTDLDAQALQVIGGQAIQVNTGKVCHLDAHMIGHSLDQLSLKAQAILFIENVGNLVCPALFDLGELYKVVILSVTEGDNKPLKYPDMFRHANLMIITKMDLLPYVDFDVNQCIEYAKRINPSIRVITLSAKTGEGLQGWYQWLNDCNC